MDRFDAGARTRGRVDLAVIVRSRTAVAARSTIVETVTRAARDLGICVVIEVAEAGIDLGKIVSGTDSEFVMFVDDSVHDVNERIKELWAQRATADLLISSRYSDDRGTRPKELRREAERYIDRLLARILTLDTNDVRSTLSADPAENAGRPGGSRYRPRRSGRCLCPNRDSRLDDAGGAEALLAIAHRTAHRATATNGGRTVPSLGST